eukprot:jgi/Ulvmu1/1666/UM114_0037.1
MYTANSLCYTVLLCLAALQRCALADTALAPGAALDPLPAAAPSSVGTPGAPAAGLAPSAPASPTRPPGSGIGTPTVSSPLAPAVDPDAVCAPFPDILSDTTDPVADFPCNTPANSREAACAQYPGCVWVPERTLCSGAFNPDACARFTVQQCNTSPFCTGVDTAQAAAGDFANGIPPPLRPPAPPDGGGTAGPNAEPPNPLDYDYGLDYTFTEDSTAGGDGAPVGGGGGAGGGGGGGAGGGGGGGSPGGTGRGRLPEFGVSGGASSSGAVSVTTRDVDAAEAPFDLPQPGSLLSEALRPVPTAAATLAAATTVTIIAALFT